MPAKVRAKLVKREPPSEKDVAEFVKTYCEMIAMGDFDTHLDLLWKATDDRLAVYMGEVGDADERQEANAQKVRRMRAAVVDPVVGNFYAVAGSAYAGTVVKFLGYVVPADEDKSYQKARIEVMDGAGIKGGVYKIPVAALEEPPQAQEFYDGYYKSARG